MSNTATPISQSPSLIPDWSALFPPRNSEQPLRVALHAPTATALDRARGNLKNLLASQPQAQVWIILNGPAVEAALDNAAEQDAALLPHLLLCPNTLKNTGRSAHPEMHVLPQGAVESLVLLQQSGWIYIRC